MAPHTSAINTAFSAKNVDTRSELLLEYGELPMRQPANGINSSGAQTPVVG